VKTSVSLKILSKGGRFFKWKAKHHLAKRSGAN